MTCPLKQCDGSGYLLVGCACCTGELTIDTCPCHGAQPIEEYDGPTMLPHMVVVEGGIQVGQLLKLFDGPLEPPRYEWYGADSPVAPFSPQPTHFYKRPTPPESQ